MLGVTDNTLRAIERRDPTFPRPIEFGSAFSLRYVRSEVVAWLAAQKRRTLDGRSATEKRAAT